MPIRLLAVAALLPALLAPAGAAHAQTWSRTYGTPLSDSGAVEPEVGAGGAVGGFHVSGIVQTAVLPPGQDAFLMHLDDTGAITWQRAYAVEGMEMQAFPFVHAPDGSWLATGFGQDAATFSFEVVVVKVDPLGGVVWSNRYGDPDDDFGVVHLLRDGGVLIDIDEDLGPTAGQNGVWLLELDADGTINWQMRYDGPGQDTGSAWELRDAGYLLGGHSDSFRTRTRDAWLVKLDGAGGIQWQKAMGSEDDDFAIPVPILREDGRNPDGYVVTGPSFSGGAGGTDTVVVKVGPSGDIQWQNLYGGTANDNLGLSWEHDGAGSLTGYFLNGLAQLGVTDLDAVVARLDPSGTILWQRTLGGPGRDTLGLRRAENGDLYLLGTTDSFGAGGLDAWIVRLDDSGDVVWQKTYGGPGDENVGVDLIHDASGSLVGFDVYGLTDSFGGGGFDAWRMRLDANGGILWQRAYGGPGLDIANVWVAGDDRRTMAGTTTSFGAGAEDVWLLRVDDEGRLQDPGCAVVTDTTAVAMDSAATVRTDYLVVSPAGWSSVDAAAVPTVTAIAPVPVTVLSRPGPLVVEDQCASSPGTAPISNLMLAKRGADLVMTWDPSPNPDHAAYRVRGAGDPVPTAPPGSFPADPGFAAIPDADGSDADETLTTDLTTDHGFFLVTDINTAGDEGPSEHYP